MAGWTGLLRLGAFEIVRLGWPVRESETVSVRRPRFTEGGLSKLVLLVAFGTRALSALRVFTRATAHQTKKSRASPAFLDQAEISRSECVFQADGIGIGASGNGGVGVLCYGAKIFILQTRRQGWSEVVRNSNTNQH